MLNNLKQRFNKSGNDQSSDQTSDREFVFEALEPRVLLSADLAGVAAQAALVEEQAQTAAAEELVIQDQEITASVVDTPQSDSLLRHEIAFVDTGAEDYELLVSDLLTNQSDDKHIEVILLDSNRNGIEQITETLANYKNIDAVHLISHGSEGQINLGNVVLNSEFLVQNTTEISQWKEAFTDDGDLLIYGCNLAATDQGQNLVNSISTITNTDVAASDNDTGQSSLGGDWILEFNSGVVETDIVISQQTQQTWNALLAETIYESHVTIDDDLEIISDDSWGQTFTHTSGSGTYNVNTINLNLYKDAGAVSQTIIVSLRSSWTGIDLGGATISSDNLTTSYASYDFNFADVALTDGNPYFIHITSNSLSGEVYVGVNSNGGYAGGNLIEDDGTTDTDQDLAFKISELTNSFVVTNTNDSGAGSLRRTLLDANAQAGTDTISFNISTTDSRYFFYENDGIANSLTGAITHTPTLVDTDFNTGWYSIQLGSALPTITDTVIIDGYSQAGAQVNTLANGSDAILKIELDGSLAGAADGLAINGSNSIISGLVVNNFGDDGIQLDTTGIAITGNYVGTDISGTIAKANGDDGVDINTASNTIGGSTPAARNLISGNNNSGIAISGPNNNIQGNYIGTDVTGTTDLGNVRHGIEITNSAGNTIGGTTAADRNVISGNDFDGIRLIGLTTTTNVIQGNYIGTNATGTSAIGNTNDGIDIRGGANTNTIGGDRTAGEGNVISGNLNDGVSISSAGTDGNLIYGNYIGTDATGSSDLGNVRHGVLLFDDVGDTQIGGTGTGQGNIISGNNDAGIVLDGNGGLITDGNVIAGNYIGTDVTGAVDLGNTTDGVRIFDGARTNTIGGTTAGAGNLISGNDDDGISIEDASTTNNAILGNAIHSNTQLGIDLNADGVTNNDLADVDTGPNELLNFPALTNVFQNGADLDIDFDVDLPAGNYRIEFFDNPSGNDPSGNGEGENYLGFASIIHTGSGVESFNISLIGVTGTGDISATTTVDLGAGNYGSTSEFSTSTSVDHAPVAQDDPTGSYSNSILNLNPLSYWRLGESAGTTAIDLGTAGNNGNYINGATLGATGALVGDADTAAEFDGVNQNVDVGNFNVAGSGITLSAWFNSDDLSLLEQRIISKANGTSPNSHTWMLSTVFSDGEYRLRFRLQAGGTTDTLIASSGALTAGQWHHATATYDAGTGEMKLFLDGQAVGSAFHSVGGAVNTDTRNVSIGANPDDQYRPFDGRIDEVAIFDKAISTDEISSVFFEGRAAYVTKEDTSLTVSNVYGVLANDTDVDGDPLTAVFVTSPANASAFSLGIDGSFSYTPTAGFSGTDSFTYRANDGTSDSAITTVTIIVDAVNDAPVVTTTVANLTYAEEDPAIAIDSSLTISDQDSATFSLATVRITNNFSVNDDLLAFVDQLGITGAYNAGTGVLTLSGVSSVANYQTALRSVSYQNITNSLQREVTFIINDGNDASLPATRLIDVSATNDAPTITKDAILADSGQSLGASFSTSIYMGDVDGDGDLDMVVANYNLQANKVYLNDGAGNFTDSGQNLGSSNSHGIELGDIDGDGDLDMVVVNFSNQPNKVYINDGSGIFSDSGQSLGNANSAHVTLGDIDDDGDLDMIVANFGGNKIYTNNGAGVFTDSGQSLGTANTRTVSLGDVDNDGDLDLVTGNDGLGNKVYLNDGSGILTDSLQSLGTLTTFAVQLGDLDFDGDLDLVEASQGGANKVFLNDGSGVYSDTGQNLGSVASNSLNLGDIDADGDLDLIFSNNVGVADQLYIGNGDGTFSTGQSLGTGDTRNLVFSDIDSDGDLDLVAANYNGESNLAYLNDSAISAFAPLALTEGDPAQILTDVSIVGDIDSSDFNGGNLTITYSVAGDAGDQLSVRNQGSGAGQIGFDGSNVSFGGTNIGILNLANNGVNGNSITIDLNSFASADAVKTLLNNITFQNTSDNPAASRTLSNTVNDGDGGTSVAITQTVSITAVNDAPSITATVTNLNYNEDDPAIVIDSGLTISDPDSTTLSLATVRITNNFSANDDLLAFVDQLGITGTYDALTGVLTLSGVSSTANYQTALRSVTYQNTTSSLQREITFMVNDGAASSLPATRLIDVSATNDAPTITKDSLFTDSGQSLGSSLSTGIATGDLDGDGDIDLVESIHTGGNHIYLNDGSGNYSFSSQILNGSLNHSTTLGDVDNDGDLDIVTGNVSVYLNNGTGSFTDSGQTLGNSEATSITLGDIDNDGDLDMVVGNGTPSVGQADKVYFNDGAGNFTDSTQSLGADITKSTALGDIDNDGDLDLISGIENAPNKVYLNNGSGDFTLSAPSNVGTSSVTTAVALGDIDGDGDLDLIEANDISPNKVFINDGSGSFTDSGQALGNARSSSLELGDIDNDGDLDLVIGNLFSQSDKVYTNNGTGTFTDSGLSLGSLHTRGISLADTNNDGDLDIVAVAGGSAANKIYTNNSVITSFTPLSLTEGDPAQTIINTGIVSDIDSSDFNGGNLTITYSVAGDAGDQLSVRNQGSGAGQIGFDGSNVSFGGTNIGILNLANNGANGNSITIDLNNFSTPDAVKTLLNNITFQNTSDNPAAGRTLSITVNDGDGGTSSTISQVITIAALNDLPSSTNATILAPNSSIFVFKATHFNFSDPDTGDSLQQIRISGIAGNGSLKNNGLAVINNQVITRADINSGLLTFTPVLGESGTNYASFNFEVHDGTAFAGATSTATINLSGLTPFFNQRIQGGGIVVDSAGMRTDVAFTGGTHTPTFNIAGIPASGTVVNAYLIINQLNYGSLDTTFSLDGNPLTVSPAGFSADPNWGALSAITYRSDVTSIVTGNGNYTLGGAGESGDAYEGAVLVVVYEDTTVTTDSIITLHNGSISQLDSPVAIPMEFNAGNPVPQSFIGANMTLVAFDGRDGFPETALDFQSTTAGSATTIIPANSFGSDQGGGEQFNIDISALITQADTGAELTQTMLPVNTDDYIVYPFLATVIQLDNAAPTLDNTGNMTLTSITEDQTNSVGDIISAVILSAGGDRIDDMDLGALEGIAITSLSSGNGSWEYSTNAGVSWNAVGVVSDASALLLRNSDFLRFVPDGQNADMASIDFRAWDHTSSTAGNKVDTSTNGGNTAFSTATETAMIDVASVNDQLTTNISINQTKAYNEGDASVALDDIIVTDVDSGEIITATLTLNAPGFGSLTTSGSANYVGVTGVWSITGTVAAVNTALANVAFIPTLNNDQNTTVSVSIVDGGENGTTAATGTITLNVTAINDVPVITTFAGTTSYTEQNSAVVIDSGLTIADPDGKNGLANAPDFSAVVRISTNFDPNDVLSFTNTANIQGNFVGDTLTLTVVAAQTATVADFEVALRSVTFFNGNDDPGILDRTVSFSFNDGLASSNTDTRTIQFTAVNDSPAVATNTGTTVSEGTTGNIITTAMLNEGDPDDSAIGIGLTYTVTTVPTNGTLRLLGVAMINGNTFTQNDINNNRVTYDHDGTETTTDSFIFDLADGGEDGALPVTNQTFSIVVTPVNDNAPVFTSPTTANVAENTTAVHQVTVTDSDLPGDTFTYSIAGSGADDVRFSIDGSGNLSFNTAPDFETPTDANTDNDYVVDVQVFDGVNTTTQTITVTVLNGNEMPTTSGLTNTTVNEDTVSSVKGLFAAFDDMEDLDPALTYTISNNTNPALFSSSVINGVAGSLTLNYAPDQNGTADITVRATDTGGFFVESTFTVTVNPVNDAPIANNETATVSEGSNVNINLAVNDTDIDSALDLTSITIISGPVNGSLVDYGDGTVSYLHDGSETLTDSFTYTINDVSGATSNIATVNLTITPVNSAPGQSIPPDQSININNDLVFSSANGNLISIYDADAGSSPLQVTLSVPDGLLTLASTSNLSFSNGSGTAVQTMTFTGTLTDINIAIDGLTFRADTGFTGSTNLQITVNDLGSGGGTPQTSTNSVAIAIIPDGIIEPPPEIPDPPTPDPETPVTPDPDIEDPDEDDQRQDPVPDDEEIRKTRPDIPDDNSPDPVSDPQPEIENTEPVFDLQPDLLEDEVITDNKDSKGGNLAKNLPQKISDISAKSNGIKLQTKLEAPEKQSFSIDPGLLHELDKIDKEISEQAAQQSKEEQIIKRSAEVGSVVLFVGFVKWLLQASSLFASLLGTLPAWRWVDPIPVLKKADDDKEKKQLKKSRDLTKTIIAMFKKFSSSRSMDAKKQENR